MSDVLPVDRLYIYVDLHGDWTVLDAEGPHVSDLRLSLGLDWRSWDAWPLPVADRGLVRTTGLWVWEGTLHLTADGQGELRGQVRDIAVGELWRLYLGLHEADC